MPTHPPISLHQDISSTNDLALEAARQGAPHGSCWMAERQLGGRGRREVDGARRTWFSPAGVNLYMSILVKNRLAPEQATTLTLAAAVGAHTAIASALEEHAGDLLIKWPNDLYLGARKLSGILSEGVLLGGRLDAVIIGVGVNVNLPASALPADLADQATSLLMHTSRPHDRLTLAHAMRHEILAACDLLADSGLPAIIERWRPHDQSKGRRVRAMIGGEWRSGTSLGISRTGGLLVELGPDDVQDVQTGEVIFER
jgi:BirA family biotin operon repressor/biotin-[acetyl-CoA-carboxylase] ligase